ncbi:hypothetical protein B7494_g3696 [Chlorociboria aeruginascens]|nr:hypothetical protein B7494_g3696 [Chlorociboria aeruginascens]
MYPTLIRRADRPNLTGFDPKALAASSGHAANDPWARREAWRYTGMYSRWNRFKGSFPGLGIATVAFAAYCGYEYMFLSDDHGHAKENDRRDVGMHQELNILCLARIRSAADAFDYKFSSKRGTVMILGVIIQISSVKGHRAMAQFIIGRVVTGVGNGINTSTIPTYQAECSRTTNRGLLICIEGGIIAFGSMIAYWIDYGAQYGSDNFTWRFPIAFQCTFAIILVIGAYFLPESPRWLLSKDRIEEGIDVIAALHGVDINDSTVSLEHAVIADSIAASEHAGGNTPASVLFTGGKTQHFRRMLLGASSQFFQQMGGCNAVIYYFPILFQTSIGTTHNLALLLGGVNMIVYSIAATVSWFIIERAGRRKLFLWGTVGQCLSMVLVFACLIPDSGLGPSAKGAGVGLFTYIIAFGATWLPLPWLYPAEINPIRTRAKANAVSTISNWLFNFTIVMATPVMISNIIIYLWYPETRRRSLEEIDLIFAKGYNEKMSYVKASFDLPFLTEIEIGAKAREYGLVEKDEEFKLQGETREGSEKEVASEREQGSVYEISPRTGHEQNGAFKND